MKKIKIKITIDNGLHLRPSRDLVFFVRTLESNIVVRKKDAVGNFKSVLSTISLCILKNEIITLEIEGKNEDEDLEKIKDFIVNERLGEIIE